MATETKSGCGRNTSDNSIVESYVEQENHYVDTKASFQKRTWNKSLTIIFVKGLQSAVAKGKKM